MNLLTGSARRPDVPLQPVSLAELCDTEGTVHTELFSEPGWISRSSIHSLSGVTNRKVGLAPASMTYADLSGCRLFKGGYPIVNGRIVFQGMHHNAEVEQEKFLMGGPYDNYLRDAWAKPHERYAGRYFLLGAETNNFWHFINNYLLRLVTYRGLTGKDPGVLAVSRSCRSDFLDLIPLLGFERERVQRINPGRIQHFEQLTVTDLPFFICSTGARAAHLPTEILRNELAALRTAPPDGGERIYVSRSDASWRRVINEPEIVDLLKRRGFRILELSSHPTQDLVRIFANASIVVGASGANLAPTIFCPKGARVFELTYEPYVEKYYFQVVSDLCGLEHVKIQGDARKTDDKYHFWDFQIPPEVLARALESCGI